MKKKIISILKSSNYFFVIQKIYNLLFPIRGNNNIIIGKKRGAQIRIIGNNNTIEIKKKALLNKIPITVFGNNNSVIIGENVHFYGGNILCDGINCKIYIGNNTTIQRAHINAQETSEIEIGEDCMFSGNIIVRTSDSHTIYDIRKQERLNPARSVKIGNHVWIAASVSVLKGVTIGDNSIIGTGSIVTHDISENCIAVGTPAKIIKKDINWDRKLIR